MASALTERARLPGRPFAVGRAGLTIGSPVSVRTRGGCSYRQNACATPVSCGSTALGAKRCRTTTPSPSHSHPGRVLLPAKRLRHPPVSCRSTRPGCEGPAQKPSADWSDLDEVLAVMAQLGNRVTDIIQRQMAAFLLKAIAHRRGPACGQFLEGRHIQIAVVEEALQLGHAAIEEAPVLADAVAAHGRAAGGHPLLQERQGLALGLGGIDAAFTDPFHQAGLVVLTG